MIPVDDAHVHVAADSHPGMSGKNNEDSFGVSAFRLGDNNGTPSLLAVVSDGIGGHLAGEVASKLAVEIISATVAESDARHPTETLKAAVIQASQAIHEQAEQYESKKGMGATCACAWMIGDRLFTASVGDSRIYLIRGDSIHQLTLDHTWIQEALEHGALTPEQALNHPNQHVIRRYLGSQKPVMPDMRLWLNGAETDLQAERNQGTRLKPGDRLLLCSDGLTDLVKDKELLGALKTQTLDHAVRYLIDLANQRGGHDNITLIALAVPRKVRTSRPRKRPRWLTLTLLGVVVILLVALLTFLFLGWYFNQPQSVPASMGPALTFLA
jgi:protein phosphatase